MKTIEEFKEFYNAELLDDLKKIEFLRKKAIFSIVILNIIGAIIFFSILPHAINGLNEDYDNVIVIYPIILGTILIAIFIMNTLIPAKYSNDYKDIILNKIILFIDNTFTYSHFDSVPKSILEKSKLFDTSQASFDGSDYVHGKIGSKDIEYSFINLSSIDDQNIIFNIFNGIFFVTNFDKTFEGQTVISPNTTQNALENIYQILPFLKSDNNLVSLEDSEFKKFFTVHSDNQVTARYILTTSFMKRLTDFRKKAGKNFYISFIDSYMYIGMPFVYTTIFEPKLFSNITSFENILEYFEHLQLFFGIVDELNLNTDICK